MLFTVTSEGFYKHTEELAIVRGIAEAARDQSQLNSLIEQCGETLGQMGIEEDVLHAIGQASADPSVRGEHFKQGAVDQLNVVREVEIKASPGLESDPEHKYTTAFEEDFINAVSEQRSNILTDTAAQRVERLGKRVADPSIVASAEPIARAGGGIRDRIAKLQGLAASGDVEASSAGILDIPDVDETVATVQQLLTKIGSVDHPDQGYHSPGGSDRSNSSSPDGSDVSRGSSPDVDLLAGGERNPESTKEKTTRLGSPPAYVPAPTEEEFGKPVLGSATAKLAQQRDAAAKGQGDTGRK